MDSRKATKVGELRRFFRQGPIAIRNLKEYYVDLQSLRGGIDSVKRLERVFRSSIIASPKNADYLQQQDDPQSHHKILFSGVRGSGKSTELNRLKSFLMEDFLVVKFSVQAKLDSSNLHFVGLVASMMEELFETLGEHDTYEAVGEGSLKKILAWTATKEIVDLRQKHLSIEGEVGAGIDIGWKWVAKFFAQFRLAAKNSKSFSETIQQKIEPKLAEFIVLCNDFISEVECNLSHFGKKGLLFIIEDLDKLSYEKANELFVRYSGQLTSINTNIVYTFPISLTYSPEYIKIKEVFDRTILLPIPSVILRNGSRNLEAIESFKEILRRRMIFELCDRPGYIDSMIFNCGGCLGDLFLMVQEAGESAASWDRQKIEEFDWKVAYNTLKNDYSRTIADKVVPRPSGQGYDVIVSGARYQEVLSRIANSVSENRYANNTLAELDLFANASIICYQDSQGEWCDAHPMVKDYLRDRGLIRSALN
jgi:hypothetical protein